MRPVSIPANFPREPTPFQIAENISAGWRDELLELREWKKDTIRVLHELARKAGGELRVGDLAMLQRDVRIEIEEDKANRQIIIRAATTEPRG